MLTLFRGVAIAGVVALVVAVPSLTGLSSPWPLLLAAAIAFASPARVSAGLSMLLGAAAWWVAMALRAGVLPDAVWAQIAVATLAIGIVVAAAAISRERLPLFAGLAGIAAFAGVYEPVFAAAPTAFLVASPLAFGAVVVAVGLGILTASVVDVLGGQAPRDRVATLRTEAVS